MAIDPDAYRVLGLVRGATRDEVKRAYRRLAKIHHPDAAGEAALPRFLAIQAAYEQLIGATPGGRVRRGPSAPPRAWEADADRAGATRRAYGGRTRTTPPGASGPTSSGGAGTTDRAGDAAGPAPGGSARTGSGAPPRGDTRSRGRRSTSGRDERRRPPNATGTGAGARPGDEPPADGGRRRRNKATLGSTSYDAAEEEPFEPDWSGSTWYGASSGTYWTINPKEYADPRKHGPEYQRRARRVIDGLEDDPTIEDATFAGEDLGGLDVGTVAGHHAQRQEVFLGRRGQVMGVAPPTHDLMVRGPCPVSGPPRTPRRRRIPRSPRR